MADLKKREIKKINQLIDEYAHRGESIEFYQPFSINVNDSDYLAWAVMEDAIAVTDNEGYDGGMPLKKLTFFQLQKVTSQIMDNIGEMAKGGALDWSNDENEALGNWLMKTKDGQSILAKSKNATELEKNVREYAKKHDGVADLEIDDEDEGLDWVTFYDLMREIKSRYAKGGKIYDREDFHEWIHKNHPTFDIDDEEFEMFIDGHYQDMLPHAKNFQNLKEWLDGEYAKGGRTKKGWSIAEDYSGVGGTKNPSYYLYNQDTGETKGRSARLTKKEATEKMKKLGYMAHGGSTHEQGYDDREDERLAMRHGKIASKDFVGSHKRREHSRRDDARFETRNK